MYQAPLTDYHFILENLTNFDEQLIKKGYVDEAGKNSDKALVDTILEEAAKLAEGYFAPCNHSGDREGATLSEGVVKTAKGFKEAYRAFVDGGWGGIQFSEELGGQNLPFLLSLAVQEMIQSANLSLSLCPLLTQGAISALINYGSQEIQALYLQKLVSGEWTGTMNLTEPQSGSDLSTIRTQALPQEDHYLIKGQKIFITWGEHNLTDNIIHLVLARLPDAPEGTRGISLFLVPKYLVNSDGSLGERNDCQALSLEDKMGIHASPTCVMNFGNEKGAIGYLIGEENQGLRAMFTMMNEARLVVGLQGVSVAESAYQKAKAYALERVQGVAIGYKETGPIIRHPDVARMLLEMKALTQGARMLAFWGCQGVDKIAMASDEEERKHAEERLALMTPIIKVWCTEIAQEVASLGLQCHGGTGYIEETGAAQFMRDARILPIYEGTNGIQALDLLFRKVLKDRGMGLTKLMMEVQRTLAQEFTEDDPWAAQLKLAVKKAEERSQWLFSYGENFRLMGAVASDYLLLISVILTSYLMLLSLKKLDNLPDEEAKERADLAKYYLLQILPRYHCYEAKLAASIKSLPMIERWAHKA